MGEEGEGHVGEVEHVGGGEQGGDEFMDLSPSPMLSDMDKLLEDEDEGGEEDDPAGGEDGVQSVQDEQDGAADLHGGELLEQGTTQDPPEEVRDAQNAAQVV